MKQNILVAEQRTGHHIVFSVQKDNTKQNGMDT